MTITERTFEESVGTRTSQVSHSQQVVDDIKTHMKWRGQKKDGSFVILNQIKKIEEFDDIEEKPYFLRKSSIYHVQENEEEKEVLPQFEHP